VAPPSQGVLVEGARGRPADLEVTFRARAPPRRAWKRSGPPEARPATWRP